MPVLTFNNVNFSYSGNTVLKDISFSIDSCEKVGLIGANGAGKTTIMKLPLGLLNPYSGTIIFNDTLITVKTISNARKNIGFIFQNTDNQLFCTNVHDELCFGLKKRHLQEKEIEDIIKKVSENFGIAPLMNRSVHTLSGGEKKSVALAAIIALNPSLLIMDEPTNALDPYNRRQLINTIKALDTTCLIASHDLDMILDTCNRVLLVHEGRIICSGMTKEVLSDSELLNSCHLELPLSLQFNN